MRSSAKETTSEGISYLNKFQIPFIAGLGNQSSFAQNGFDAQGAVAMVEASATDISLLAGLIKFDSVVTRATARSDGVKGAVAGTTTITGAKIQGVGDVIIDTEGVHIADQGVAAAPAQQALNQILNLAGVSMELSAPVDTISGPKGSRSLGGLLIRVKSSTLEPLIAALPAELQQQIRGQLTLDQAVAIQIAPAVVTAAAAKNIPLGEAPPSLPEPDVSAGGASAPVDTGSSGSTGGGGTTTPVDTGTGGGGTVIAAPARVSYDGVPVWLVALLMIVAFVSSRPLTAFADRVFAARSGGRCPAET